MSAFSLQLHRISLAARGHLRKQERTRWRHEAVRLYLSATLRSGRKPCFLKEEAKIKMCILCDSSVLSSLGDGWVCVLSGERRNDACASFMGGRELTPELLLCSVDRNLFSTRGCLSFMRTPSSVWNPNSSLISTRALLLQLK